MSGRLNIVTPRLRLKFLWGRPLKNYRHKNSKEAAMNKELMIQKLMREIEMDFSFDLRLGLIDRVKFNNIMKSETEQLRERGYSEIEKLFLRVAA